MKRRLIFAISVIILLGGGVFYFNFIYGNLEFRRNKDTPKEYLSRFIIKRERYLADSTAILIQFRGLINKHKGFFYSDEFDNSTQIIIDTILYNSNFNKLAILVFTKNAMSRQLMPDSRSRWYYNATCYLGTREKDSINLAWLGENFTNSINLKELKDMVREYFFRVLATTKDPASFSKFNLNDTRFWNSAAWKADDLKSK